MSRYGYEFSQKPDLAVGPFDGLIMAAMRRADTDNLERLKLAFPDLWVEFQARYWAPGGLLPGEGIPGAVADDQGGA